MFGSSSKRSLGTKTENGGDGRSTTRRRLASMLATMAMLGTTLALISGLPAQAQDTDLQVIKTSWKGTDCPDFNTAVGDFFPFTQDGNIAFVGAPISFCFLVTNTSTTATVYDVEVIDNAATANDTSDDYVVDLIDPATDQVITGQIDLAPGAVVYGVSTNSFPQAGNYDNTAFATGTLVDGDPSTLTSSSDLTKVTIFDISATKVASESVVDEGDDVTFSFTVKNNSIFENFVLAELNDSVFGDVTTYTALGQGTCALPVVISPQGDFSCSITAPLDTPGLHENTITAVGTGPDGTELTVVDDAEVTVNDLPASIVANKVADVTELPVTGGPVTFTFSVLNTSAVDDVEITLFTDSVFGSLNGFGNCTPVITLPTTLAAGEVLECMRTETITGDPNSIHENVLIVAGVGDDGEQVGDTDDEEVEIGEAGSIEIVKTADVDSVPEAGGDVTYTFTVTNTSTDADVTVTSMNDDKLGDLATACNLPQTLVAGASFDCSATATISGNAGTTHTNVVTASGTDEDGNIIGDTDEEDVVFTDVAPEVKIVKMASTDQVSIDGEVVDFTFTITNDSSATDAVTIDSLIDDVFGDITAECNLDVVVTLQPGENHVCVISRLIEPTPGSGGTSYVNPAPVTGSSNQLLGHSDPVACMGGISWNNTAGTRMGAFAGYALTLDTGLQVPAGTWAVDDFLAWDADIDRPNYPQSHEILRIEFHRNGALVAASTPTIDLIDGTVTAWVSGGLGIVDLPNGADEVKIVHSNLFNGSRGTNSLDPVSLCLQPVPDDGIAPHHNVATVCVTDDEASMVCDQDDATVTFSEEPVCMYGLNRNYWRRFPASWPAGVNPTDLVTTHFGPNAALNGGTDTLADALFYNAGGGINGAKRILIRDAVAGLLNESYFASQYAAPSVNSFTADVAQTLGSTTRRDLITKAREIRIENRGTCPVPRNLRPHRQ